MSDSKAVADAEVIKRFLADPVIQGCLERLHQKYYRDFRQQKSTAAEREITFAKSSALDDFAMELMAVKDAGTAAKARVDREELVKSQQPKPRRN